MLVAANQKLSSHWEQLTSMVQLNLTDYHNKGSRCMISVAIQNHFNFHMKPLLTTGGGGFSAKFRVGGCRPQFENVTVG